MIELRTLGSVQLDAPQRPEARTVGAQPKRLALLAYLALAEPPGPRRRDALLALLWPESDQEKGRQVLRQTVYLLRQSLGGVALVSRSDEELELDATVVSCDARRFEQHVAAGRLREALDLYRGDFLDGFFVPGVAQEFDEWVATQRRRLRGLASSAAWKVSSEDELEGQANGALQWARRASQLDPENENGVRDLMLLQRRLGDRIGALRTYDEYVARLERDLGTAPGKEIQTLAAEMRVDVTADSKAGLRADSKVALKSDLRAVDRRVPRVRGRSTGIAIAVVLVSVMGFSWFAWRARATDASPLLAVGAIVDVVSPDSSAEQPVLSDLLATNLARLNGLHVIPAARLYDVQAQLRASGQSATLLSAARQAGASQLLSGTLHRDERGALHLDGQILALSSGTVVQTVRMDGKDLYDLVDRTTEALARRLGLAAPEVPIADVTTRSFVAYRLYQEGLRAYYATDLRTAQGLFRAAEAEDSSFAMATYFDGMLGIIFSQSDASTVLDRAARLAARAPDRERLLIRYRVAAQHQSPEAMALAETLSVKYPNDLDAMMAVGALRQRAGQWTAAAAQYRAVIRLDSLSLHAPTARCVACEAYTELWWSEIYGDSMQAAERTMREWAARQAKGRNTYTADPLSIALERQDRFAEALALWRDVPGPSMRRVLIAIRAGDYAAARDTLRMLRRAPSLAIESDWWTSVVLRNEGRPSAAVTLSQLELAARAPALFEAGRYREAAALHDTAIRGLLAGDPAPWPRRVPWQMVHLATALSAAHDTMRLTALADSAQRIGAVSFFGRDPLLHHYIRGLLWEARGDTARAADAFRASIWSWTDGYTRANYELAKALFVLGRPREAVYPLQSALRGDLQSSNLYLARTEAHALLARVFDALGQADSAAVHRNASQRAWAGAEPGLPARLAIEGLRVGGGKR